MPKIYRSGFIITAREIGINKKEIILNLLYLIKNIYFYLSKSISLSSNVGIEILSFPALIISLTKTSNFSVLDEKYSNIIARFTGTSILINLKLKESLIILTNRIHPNRYNTNFLELREYINKIFMEN